MQLNGGLGVICDLRLAERVRWDRWRLVGLVGCVGFVERAKRVEWA